MSVKRNYREIVKVYESQNQYNNDFENKINKMIADGWKVKTMSVSTSGMSYGYNNGQTHFKTICVVCYYNYDFIDLTKKPN